MRAALPVDPVELHTQPLEQAEGRLAHVVEDLVLGVLRRDLEAAGGVAQHQLLQVGLARLVEESFLVQEEVVADAAADVGVPDALDSVHGTVELQQAVMRAVQVGAGLGEDAGLAPAFRAQVLVAAVHAVHVGGRGAQVGDVAVELRHRGEPADLLEDGFLAARLDEFALVGGDRAEVAAAEAAAVRDDRVLDHVVGRDALALVARVRPLGERQVPAGVHLLRRRRRIRRRAALFPRAEGS